MQPLSGVISLYLCKHFRARDRVMVDDRSQSTPPTAPRFAILELGSVTHANMFIIDITLKNTPLSLSVQRKSEEDAEAVYQKILQVLRSGSNELLELSCEKQPGKKIGILGTEISAVQISDKSGTAAASGRPPGFFALAE